MEYVRGVPITTYADKHKLTTQERLELFIPLCEGVQHAHQKGIIHRDLKPSNILVARHDDKPVPKVIDFGIVKATDTKLTDKTLLTHHGQFMGTPDYMSPEQAQGLPDVDTRTDVYALGVVLYELLTGHCHSIPRDCARSGTRKCCGSSRRKIHRNRARESASHPFRQPIPRTSDRAPSAHGLSVDSLMSAVKGLQDLII